MKRPPVLETKALTCRFGEVTAVDRIDFRVEEGEIRCVIGPNGAGKSTLFKCLTRQQRQTSGQILLRSADISGRKPHEIARLGVAIKNQIPSVYPGFDVRENVALAARRHASGRALAKAVDAVLDEIGFAEPSLSAQRVGELSHAHRQWVELGMLLASRPTLALLDEPAAGMTRDEMLRTVDIVRRLNRHATVVVVEHDLEMVALLGQRVTVLHRGAIVAEDSMDRIVNDAMVRAIYIGSGGRAYS